LQPSEILELLDFGLFLYEVRRKQTCVSFVFGDESIDRNKRVGIPAHPMR